MKKTFAFILAVIMLVGLFTGVVSAADEKTELLSVPEIVAGEHGTWGSATADGETITINGTAGYCAFEFWTKKNASDEYNIKKDGWYLITFKAKGTAGETAQFDLDNGGSGMAGDHTFATNDWEDVAKKVQCTTDAAEHSNEGVRGNGFSGRVYSSIGVDFQVKDIVIYEVSEDYVVETTPVTPETPEEPEEPKEEPKEETKEEVLGANELAGASFGAASDANNWWFRADWNSSWKIEDGVLVAIGSGADNNGAFYNTKGEGQELSLTLKKGETYVVSMKVFRPAGVDSDSYLDINEGALASIHAEKNGEWETLTARFVANDKPIKLRLVVNALADGETVMFDDIELRMVGGDPNKTSSNPATSDNMVIGFVAVAMVVAVAGVAVVAKKRVLSK